MGKAEERPDYSQMSEVSSRLGTLASPDSKFAAGLEYLNYNYPYLLTHVLNIGEPAWSDQIDTAAVASANPASANPDFFFVFNPEFIEELSAEEVGFVAAHETMHILLNHIQLARQFENKQLFNIAADAVINDSLADQGMELIEGVAVGNELIGENCANLTVREVYEELLKRADSAAESDSGSAGADPFGDIREIDSHTWTDGRTGAAAEAFYQKALAKGSVSEQIADMRADESGDFGEARAEISGSFASSAGPGVLEAWRKESGVSLAWEELLKEIDPDIFADLSGPAGPPPRPSFRQRPRWLAAFPETNLPVYETAIEEKSAGKGRPAIVMALDTSGSISDSDARRFITLARSIPRDKVELFCCTFTTGFSPLDLDKPTYPSGGTDFSAIEDFIRQSVVGQELGSGEKISYPKAVVVITDGYASFSRRSPNPSNLPNWTWLLTSGGSADYINSHYSRVRAKGRSRTSRLTKFISKQS